MPYVSVDPATSRVVQAFPSLDSRALAARLERVAKAGRAWAVCPVAERAGPMTRLARLLIERGRPLAELVTRETGKPVREALQEVENCALACDYYAVHAEHFIAAEDIPTGATRSCVAYEPLGTVLGVLPWPYPFWHTVRFAVPTLMAGNACAVKPASSVPGTALAIEALFREAGFDEDLFSVLLIEADQVADAIASHHVHGVSFTGSEPAGRKVAALAGQHLKKCVLELGGSDAFVVLADADPRQAAEQAVRSCFQNCGQSCLAAKRMIVVPEVADAFVAALAGGAGRLRAGPPMEESTDLGPLARADLREELHRQVTDSVAQGAEPLLGCEPMPGEGSYYPASVLDRVTSRTRAYHEVLFGPVAAVIRVAGEDEAIDAANDTRYGLGASLWSRDPVRAAGLARRIEAGSVFVNSLVRTDPRLPFGGVKASGFGRELSYHGIREFTNAKTVWVR